MSDEQIRVEYVPLSQIERWPRNPKMHRLDLLDQSLDRFGYVQPLTLDERTGRLVAGHGRLAALAQAKAAGKNPPKRVVARGGEWLVPVVRGISFASDEEAEAFIVADNRINELGGWDEEVLAGMTEGALLEGVGFSQEEIQDLQDAARFPFETLRLNVSELRDHPRNYRRHPDDQLAHIVRSIETHGFYRNVVIARDNTILAGHGVVQAARKMGRASVPVIRLDLSPDDPRALKVLTSDNEIGHLAETDDRGLTELLKGILDSGGGLEGTGYNEEQLAALAMVTRPARELRDMDAAAAWVGMPEYDSGEYPAKLVVTFASLEDRDRFVEEHKLRIDKGARGGKSWSTRWPWTDREDSASIKFEAKSSPLPPSPPDPPAGS